MKFPLLFSVLLLALLLGCEIGSGQAPAPAPAPPVGNGNVNSQPPPLDQLFSSLDFDHDGKISRSEATGAFAQRFSLWDQDHDGFATRQEIHDYRTSLGIDDSGKRSGQGMPPGQPPSGRGSPAGSAAPTGPRSSKPGAVILKEPADWRFENLPVPPGFAPEVKIKGEEEIRFAPGMYDSASETYFSYVVALSSPDVAELSAADLQDFLQKYFRGLSANRASRKNLKVDLEKMTAQVAPASAGEKGRYEAQVIFFDSFSDGRQITLNVEAQVVPRTAPKPACLLLLISPSVKESPTWKTLREIAQKALLNLG